MRWMIAGLVVVGCSGSDSKPAPVVEPARSVEAKAAPKPPDEMDEKMRHCPLALDGANTTLAEIDGGVRFEVKVPAAAVAETQRRAHHIVEFAAKRHAGGTHGAFDGKGGGKMKNCPVVTDDVTIVVQDLADGARIDVIAAAEHVAALRSESHARTAKFPFVGAKVVDATSKRE